MSEIHLAVDASISEIDKLRKIISQSKSKQVQSLQERTTIKSFIHSWFNNHSKKLVGIDKSLMQPLNDGYNRILKFTDSSALRTRYTTELKALKKLLIEFRSNVLSNQNSTSAQKQNDSPPDFSPLVPNITMCEILNRRWIETCKCIQAEANLAAMIMMGGLLEGLILAKIHKSSDKEQESVFKAKSAPKDKKTGKTLPLKNWGLQNFLDVSHELKWITQAANDVGTVMRDYRNYIHPEKEYTEKSSPFTPHDTYLIWNVFKSITQQILSNMIPSNY